jgi:hypothetical protein
VSHIIHLPDLNPSSTAGCAGLFPLYPVFRAPTAVESHLPQILWLSHDIASSNSTGNNSLVTTGRWRQPLTAITLLLLVTVQHRSNPQPNTPRWTFFSYLGSSFLQWHPFVPCLRVTHCTAAADVGTHTPMASGGTRI